MKNYWLKLHEQKKSNLWTIEFVKSGIFSLRPRQIQIANPNFLANYKLGVLFVGAMLSTQDNELLNFLSDANYHGLRGHGAVLRKYKSVSMGTSGETESFEFTGLYYDSLTSGKSLNDIKFVFKFNSVRHVYTI